MGELMALPSLFQPVKLPEYGWYIQRGEGGVPTDQNTERPRGKIGQGDLEKKSNTCGCCPMSCDLGLVFLLVAVMHTVVRA